MILGAALLAASAAATAQETPRTEERIDRIVDDKGAPLAGTDDSGDSMTPKIATVGDYVVAVWADGSRATTRGSDDIFLSYSFIVPAGEFFNSPIRVDEDDSRRDFSPIVLAQDHVTVVAWLKELAHGKIEVWARAGTADPLQGGFNWSSPPRRVSAGLTGDCKSLTGAICLPYVYLAFECDHNVAQIDDLFVAASSDSGKTWPSAVQVNDPVGGSAEVNDPKITVSLPEEEGEEEEEHDGSGVGAQNEGCCEAAFVVWGDRRSGGNDEVWFSRTLDGGANWDTNVRVDDSGAVGFDADAFSIAAVECQGVFVSWVDDRFNVGIADRPWFSFTNDAFDPLASVVFDANYDLSTQGLAVDADNTQVVATHDLDVVVAWGDDRRGAGRQDMIVNRGIYSVTAGTVTHGNDENTTAALPPSHLSSPVLRASEGAIGVSFLGPRTASGWTLHGARQPWLAFWDDTLVPSSWQLLHLATTAPRDQTMMQIDFALGDHSPWEGHVIWSTLPPVIGAIYRQIWIGGLDRDHGTGRPNNAPGAGAAVSPP
jgi:hypothetical protein